MDDDLSKAIYSSPFVRYKEFFRHTQPGLFMEFGVWQGHSIRHLAHLVTERFWGFDSWEGLPEEWGPTPKGAFRPSRIGDIPDPVDMPANVRLIKGMFQDTLPGFLYAFPNTRVSFVNIDCDLYSSSKFVLDFLSMGDRLNGAIVVFDELMGFPHYEEHEGKAFREFLAQTGYKYTCLGRPHDHAAGFKLFR